MRGPEIFPEDRLQSAARHGPTDRLPAQTITMLLQGIILIPDSSHFTDTEPRTRGRLGPTWKRKVNSHSDWIMGLSGYSPVTWGFQWNLSADHVGLFWRPPIRPFSSLGQRGRWRTLLPDPHNLPQRYCVGGSLQHDHINTHYIWGLAAWHKFLHWKVLFVSSRAVYVHIMGVKFAWWHHSSKIIATCWSCSLGLVGKKLHALEGLAKHTSKRWKASSEKLSIL